MPRVDTRDRRGRIYVVNYRNGSPVGPPLVFDRNGRFLAALGRFGSGFGATSMPSWIDAGWDDTTRVYDRGRVVVFGPDLRPVRSLERTDLPRGVRDGVGYPRGGFAALSDLPAPAGAPFAVFLSRPGRASSAVLPPLTTPALDGPHRKIARVRGAGADRLWVAQFALSRGHGYDLLQADTSGRVHSAVRRRPAWWVTADLSAFSHEPIPSSRVVAIREIAEGVVAILIAQPKPDWERVGVERGTMAGWWNRYDGRLELVDVRRGAVLGSTHVRGMPLRILDDATIVTYSEDERATPSVELWHVSVR